ncbi:coniferyl aldehyde dehydrogenase [Chitinivorax sp. PXF-14]|uniref:coniferyl aldehyde dehydrogenase n=1 Tax=Chitinivorax sp. PXF-14 TaxID=3230488 RepID=UPI003466A70E
MANETAVSINSEQLIARQRDAYLAAGIPSLHERKQQLARLRRAVIWHRHELEDSISTDFGHRSRHETSIMELVGVVQAIDYLSKNLRKFMKRERRHVALFHRFGRAFIEYQPKGVIGVMSPWNYPVSLSLIPIATAIAAGNRVMLKPSELTPRTSELLQRMLSGIFSLETVAVVLGGADVGADFSRLPFDHLLFTGSTPVGRKIMQAASDNLVPLTLELGGKSPAVIARGHVSPLTMQSLVYGKLSNAGQTCVAPDFAMVHADDLDAFVSSYSAMVDRFYPDGTSGTDYTSIVSDRHLSRLTSLLDDAKVKGARVVTVGTEQQPPQGKIRVMRPTLVVGASDDMLVMQEEIFGPVLPVVTYRDMADVINYINARPRPLALYYFGETGAECNELMRRTTSGHFGVNHTLTHVALDDAPFGGVGASGMGAYHGMEGFRSMSHAKSVYVQSRWSLPRLMRAPFGRLADFALALTLGPSQRQ